VHSLKEITPGDRTENAGTNPENTADVENSKKKTEKRKSLVRAISVKKG